MLKFHITGVVEIASIPDQARKAGRRVAAGSAFSPLVSLLAESPPGSAVCFTHNAKSPQVLSARLHTYLKAGRHAELKGKVALKVRGGTAYIHMNVEEKLTGSTLTV